jgi:uncharacterized membrane protein YfcA
MFLLLFSIGLAIGAILGLTGAGGSVIAVPVLLLTLGISPAQATGLALGVVAASSLYGSWQRLQHREILWVAVGLFMLGGILMAPLGRWVAHQMEASRLMAGFMLLSSAIAIRMLWQSIRHPEDARVVRARNSDAETSPLLCRFGDRGQFDWRLRCMIGLSGGGLVTGFLSGLFGVGGGFLIVPFLNQLNGLSMRHAVATSLVIIAGISSSGFIAHVLLQGVDWSQLGMLGAGGVGGMLVGSALAKRMAGAHLQALFAVTILVITALSVFR